MPDDYFVFPAQAYVCERYHGPLLLVQTLSAGRVQRYVANCREVYHLIIRLSNWNPLVGESSTIGEAM